MKRSVTITLGAALLAFLCATAGYGQVEEGLRLQKAGKYREAIAKFEEVLKDDPTNPQALCGIGVSYSTLAGQFNDVEMYRKAVRYLDTLTKKYGNFTAYRFYHANAAGALAERLADSKEKTELLNLAEQEMRYAFDNEKTPQAKFFYKGRLASALAANEKFDEAETRANEILAEKPDDEYATIILGRVEAGRGYDDKAAEKYMKVLTANPKSGDAIYRLSLLTKKYGDAKEYEKAVKLLEGMAGLEMVPFWRAEAYKQLAENRICLDDLSGGIEALLEGEKIKADDANFPNRLGLVYLAVGDRNKAIDAFKRAIGVNPDLLYPYENMGTELAVAGRIEEACRCFRDGWQAAGRVLRKPKQKADFKAEAEVYRALFRWNLDQMEAYRK
ncbi:MAG: tetratricopeptide repeat protein [Planctomycetota bacterium]|jgi:tetratricopeptide (TPR) repeat protein